MNAWRFPIIKRAWVLPKMSADSFKRDLNDNRPVVLCCGDSITHGHIGYDWVGSLRDKDSSKIYVNAGVNGDLAWNLNQRLKNALQCNPDYITILIGTNDAMGSQKIQFIQESYVTNKELPQLPSIDWYEKELESMIQYMQSNSNAKIAISTLPWVGEHDSHSIMDVVRNHNVIIKNIAEKYNLTLIDLFDHLSHIIGNNSSSAPYVTTQWRTIRIIRAVILHYVFGWNWEKIGKKYGLKTMCDHIHLNENGGIILENLIKEFLD